MNTVGCHFLLFSHSHLNTKIKKSYDDDENMKIIFRLLGEILSEKITNLYMGYNLEKLYNNFPVIFTNVVKK